MCLQALYGNMFILVVILLQTAAIPIDSSQSKHTALSKVRVDPTHLRYFKMFNTMPNSMLRDKNNSAIPSAKSGVTNFNEWSFNEMAPKQYEIVNMLWKKRKVFNQADTITYRPIYYPLLKSPFVIHQPITTTPSVFEFYYLDENYATVNASKGPRMQKIKNIDVIKTNNADYQIFAFHINKPIVAQDSPNESVPPYGKNEMILSTRSSLPVVSTLNSVPFKKVYVRMPFKRTPRSFIDTSVTSSPIFTKLRSPGFKSLNKEVNEQSKGLNNLATTDTYRNEPKGTTANDRIKFFEMYDKLTPLPNFDLRGNLINLDYTEYLKKSADALVVISDHVKTNTAAPISNQASNENNTNDLKVFNNTRKTTKPFEKNNNKDNINDAKLKDPATKEQSRPHKLNKLAVWSENSFMAVYIYEPSQVRCDAAGISPHWLVTSGSCLSRHHKNPGGEGRSAFVAYCGTTWWNAERIAYVKYSVVHPNYHQRDAVRKYMYNIGLVQVVNAMSTCPGWSPISLMSHQFTSDPRGSTAFSVGWGLDRYNVLYPTSSLPRNPLLIYESQVFSDGCPGSVGYAHVKQESGEEAVRNVYCLSLPTYNGEAGDPIHGSMLIVEGKLCAIFLQEERRMAGQQCAEYTGTWRLNSWIHRVASEMDYSDQFPFEI